MESRKVEHSRDWDLRTAAERDVVEEEEQERADRAAMTRTSLGQVQMRFGDGSSGQLADAGAIREAADAGVAGAGEKLPHLGAIQSSFGPRHQVGTISAHVGGNAATATEAIGAEAYASGDRVAFQDQPDLHTAAHEAAHVIQQQSGVQLKGGVGEAGDAFEQEADAVADLVSSGRSAAPILDRYAPLSAQGIGSQAVQMKPKGNQPASPVVDDSAVLRFIEHGEAAALFFTHATQKANALYGIVLTQAGSKVVHEQNREAFEQAREARAESLKASAIEKIFTAVSAITSLAGTAAELVKALRSAASSARGLSQAYNIYSEHRNTPGRTDPTFRDAAVRSPQKDMAAHAAKRVDESKRLTIEAGRQGGEAIRGGASAIGEGRDTVTELTESRAGHGGGDAGIFDPQTILAETNHQAIVAGNAALDTLMETHIEDWNLLDIGQVAEHGALEMAQMGRGLSALNHEGKALSPAMVAKVDETVGAVAAKQAEFAAASQRLNHVWGAYKGGGAEALADPAQRNIYQTVAGWVHSGDPKARGLRVAMDQEIKNVHFWGESEVTESDVDTDHWYKAHSYFETYSQNDEGTLYISDPAAEQELRRLGLALDIVPARFDAPGIAESFQDDRNPNAKKYVVSISLCQALHALGVEGKYLPATVNLYDQGVPTNYAIKYAQKGAWFDHWWNDPKFEPFWRSVLAGQWGYVTKQGSNKKDTFAAATDEDRKRSHRSIMTRTAI